jgi:hypothetical protein
MTNVRDTKEYLLLLSGARRAMAVSYQLEECAAKLDGNADDIAHYRKLAASYTRMANQFEREAEAATAMVSA